MLRLMFTSIRSRMGNFAGALVAVTIAIALIAATTILIFAASNADVHSERFAGTDVIVQAKRERQLDLEGDDESETQGWVLYQRAPRIPADLVDEISQLPGVEAAIADVQFDVQLLDPAGELLPGPDGSPTWAASWASARLTPFVIVEGREPSAADEIVIDAWLANAGGFAPGDTITVLSRELPASYRISGIAGTSEGTGLSRHGSIFFADETAARLAGSNGMADQIGVIAAPGVEASDLARAIESHLDDPRLHTLTGSRIALADPSSDAEHLEGVVAVMGTMASFSGFVAIFVIASTFTFSILQRQREIGLLRACGATPRQVRRMVGAEALLLALTGSAIGLPAGALLADQLARMLIRFGIAPDGFVPELSVWPLLIAAGCGIAITQLAVFGAARKAARIRPIEAMREASAQRRLIGWGRLLTGLLFLVGGVVTVVLVPALDGDAQIAMSFAIAALFLIAAALLGPLLSLLVTWLVGGLLGRFVGTSGELAAWNGRGAPNRIASVASPLMLAVGFACLMFFLTATLQVITINHSRARTTADLVVLSSGADLPIELLPEIQALDGVGAASGLLGTTGAMDRHRGDVLELDEQLAAGVDPATLVQIAELDVIRGSLDRLEGNSMALSRLSAEMFKGDIGDVFEFHLDDGTIVPVEIVAIYNNFMGFEEILFPLELAGRMARTPSNAQIYVRLDDGATAGEVAAAISDLHPDLVTLHVLTRDEYIATIDQAMVQGAWAVYLIIGVSVFFAGIAVINTMAMSTSERAREFALLRMIGATRNQVRSMVLSESLIVTLIGTGTGIVVGLLSMVPVSLALAGEPWSIGIPWLTTAGVVGSAAAIAVVAHLLPARWVLRSSAVENMGVRE